MVILASLAMLAGCAGEPYVRNPAEFKRDTAYFLEGLTDRTFVEVCYNKRKTTPEAIRKLAIDECNRFGRIAAFSKTTYNVCPLTTPVAAVYDCLNRDENTGSPERKVGS